MINFRPLGIIQKIVPFNFPIWTGIKFIVPNILNGNSVVLRFSEDCLLVAELVEDLIR